MAQDDLAVLTIHYGAPCDGFHQEPFPPMPRTPHNAKLPTRLARRVLPKIPLIYMMTSQQIRKSFLDFFKSKRHTIVPSSSLMPDSPNLLFTNAGMNQFVPIFLGQTKCPYTPGRAADTQKCIRAGGKHNDLEDVGLDTYHHTFFEMLGNWSFGDYFKKEAIAWAWELVVVLWKFPPSRIYATAFCPYLGQPGWEEKWKADFDLAQSRLSQKPGQATEEAATYDESSADIDAIRFWVQQFQHARLDPRVHIIPGGKKDNFWMMGETGPCGPCSELHVDLTPNGDTNGSLVNKGDARCIEIWNLVFIQFNANPDGTFSPLPAKHVDTGMGFERVASIIQGTQRFTDFANVRISNYETDIFRPIFDALEKLSGKKYASTLPDAMGSTGDSPVPLGDPPGGMGKTITLESGAAEQEVAASHSAGLAAQRHGQVARATQEQIQIDVAFRVIADHIRTLSFAIADGIQPGNNDRNYVLRRILRRAVRYGRTLGFREPFFYKLVDVLADTLGDVFPEIRARKQQVQETIQREEEAFNRTLDRGIRLFEEGIAAARETGNALAGHAEALGHKLSDSERATIVPGNLAFELYDTYGFPLDLTELMARERGLTVDVAGFNKLMEEQRARARAAQKKEVISVSQIETTTPTQFVGYEKLETLAKVIEVVSLKDKTAVILDASACYAEMGGQVGDTGELAEGGNLWRITNTQKSGSTWLHFIEASVSEPDRVAQATRLSRPATGRTERESASFPNSAAFSKAGVNFVPVGGSPTGTGESPVLPIPGASVSLSVDKPRRDAIQRHHTVTHLLHWALHEVASRDASQKGSFVGADKLTFDFNSAPLTPQQVADIEKLVNERIVENAGVSWTEVPYADVKSRKDVMQFFGDKYGDTVRVVQIGGHAAKLDGYSMELCGGTHTRATGEIGLFRIVGESAIAAGVRRIEAVAGLEAYRKVADEVALIKSLAGKVNSPVHELEKKIESLLEHQKAVEKQLKAAQQREASNAASELLERVHTVNGVPAIIHNVGGVDGDFLQAIADSLKGRFKGVIVLGGAAGGAVSLIAAVTPEFTKQIQAGKIIQQIAPIVGGKGGGKPDNARGGGRDATKLDEALAKARSLI
jgi:alanyl-tRNA synthetase